MKVLISDPLGDEGLDWLRQRGGYELDVATGLDEDALRGRLRDADALIVRSGTQVTSRLLEAGDRLKVVGRAGIGVDNIDVEAATLRGVVVLNTPAANATTTAELTIAHLLSLSRKLPQADRSLRAGEWKRSKLVGSEVAGKTVGVVGFGTIGRIVADRCLGLRMRVLAHDPFVTDEAVREAGAEPRGLDALLAGSDYVTLHVPLLDATRNLVDAERLGRMKQGAYLLNCARGGLVDEAALLEALRRGHLAGAALDVFEHEPPGASPLLELENVVATPHLGASTHEAQSAVSLAIVQQVATYLETGEPISAVNLAQISGEELQKIRPYQELARKLGRVLASLTSWPVQKLEIRLSGRAADLPGKPLAAEALAGLLGGRLDVPVNAVNAPHLAKRHGIATVESREEDAKDYVSLLTLTARGPSGSSCVAGTLLGERQPRLVRIDGYDVEVVPEGTLLVTQHEDRPGVIGALGTLLGREGVNISRMQLGLSTERPEAMAVLCLSQPLSAEQLERVRGIDAVRRVWHVSP